MGLLLFLLGIAGMAGAVELEISIIPASVLMVVGFVCTIIESYIAYERDEKWR